MNLHGLVSGAIDVVNPRISGSIKVSTGSTITPSGVRVPTYSTLTGVPMQVQSLTTKDLRQVDMLNLQGTLRVIYLYGEFDGVVRPKMKGGDLVVVTTGVNAGVWLVTTVLEQWPDWCKVVVTLQSDVISVSFVPSLNFSDARNSQYLGVLEQTFFVQDPIELGGGNNPPVTYHPALRFNDRRNSQYVPLITPGGGNKRARPSLDFSKRVNSQYLALIAPGGGSRRPKPSLNFSRKTNSMYAPIV